LVYIGQVAEISCPNAPIGCLHRRNRECPQVIT